MLITLDQALEGNVLVTIHVVSGEYYEGYCLMHENNKCFFKLKMQNQTITLPVWIIKRIHLGSIPNQESPLRR